MDRPGRHIDFSSGAVCAPKQDSSVHRQHGRQQAVFLDVMWSPVDKASSQIRDSLTLIAGCNQSASARVETKPGRDVSEA